VRSVPVYAASKFENKEIIRVVHDELRRRGHTVTSDWTTEDATGMAGEVLESYMRECADKAVDGVCAAEVLLLIDHPACKGAYSELGIAIGLDKKIIVVGGVPGRHGFQNVMMHLPEVTHLATISEALDLVDEYARTSSAPPPLVEIVAFTDCGSYVVPEARA
jgi:hypothetical protein